jgi:signal peptidase II
LDQFTKWLVSSSLAIGESAYPIPALAPFVAITLVTNTGVAFGLFQNANTFFALVSMVVSSVVVRYLIGLPQERRLLRFALTLVLAGAIGNLIDRLRVGYVIDFVAIGDFAKFNVADSAISTGVVLLAIGLWLEGRPEASPPTPTTDAVDHETPRSSDI